MTDSVPANVPIIPLAPPHPLDATWFMHTGQESYGPFTGHQLREFVRDGRLSPDTQVARAGSDKWLEAQDDPTLKSLFKVPAIHSGATRGSSETESNRAISAARGATIVQVTNNLAPQPHAPHILLETGEAKPKSAGTALLLSILFIGAGQIYNGQILKGIGMMVLTVAAWFILLGWIIMIWSWIDAYQTAKAMNLRYQRRLAAGVIL